MSEYILYVLAILFGLLLASAIDLRTPTYFEL
jgi:hypothetical protein